MIRATGFVIGVCLMSVLFVLLVKPETAQWLSPLPATEVADLSGKPARSDAVLSSQTGVPPLSGDPVSGVDTPPAGKQPGDTAKTAQDDPSEPDPPSVADSAPVAVTNPGRDLETDSRDSIHAAAHLFWSPFRSEWAAQGFAERLRVTTSVPVEVIRLESGQYRVGFSYRDEEERLALKERIEAITGLELESP